MIVPSKNMQVYVQINQKTLIWSIHEIIFIWFCDPKPLAFMVVQPGPVPQLLDFITEATRSSLEHVFCVFPSQTDPMQLS